MAGNRRTGKKMTHRAVRLPALIKVRMAGEEMPLLAGRLHAGIMTLIARPSVESCNNLSEQLCVIAGGMSHTNKGAPILGRKDAASIAIFSAIRTIECIVARHDRTGAVGITDAEAQTLRGAAAALDQALSNIPIHCYQRAEMEVRAVVAV